MPRPRLARPGQSHRMHRQVGDQAASDTWVTDRLDLSLWPVCGTAHLHFSISAPRDPLAIAEDAGERESPHIDRAFFSWDEEFQNSHVISKQTDIQPVSHLAVVQSWIMSPAGKGAVGFTTN